MRLKYEWDFDFSDLLLYADLESQLLQIYKFFSVLQILIVLFQLAECTHLNMCIAQLLCLLFGLVINTKNRSFLPKNCQKIDFSQKIFIMTLAY